MLKVLGVDPSTYTGLCLFDGVNSSTSLIHFPKESGFSRLQSIAEEFGRLVTEWAPDCVFIEGYAFGNRYTIVTLVEIGTMLRSVLWDRHILWYDVPPPVLKKYVTGKGNASKKDMAASVKEHWGFESSSDDVVDAYGLARLGYEYLCSGLTLKGVIPCRR